MVDILRKAATIIISILGFYITNAQVLSEARDEMKLTHADTLRGSNSPFRKNWDVLKYEITIKPDFNNKIITGCNKMTFFDKGVKLMQIDLQEPMELDSITDENKSYKFRREGNVYWVELRDTNAMYKIRPMARSVNMYFHGKPKEAVKPPWQGGWIWEKDNEGNPWITVACQGLGASVWYPCKDIQSDKPDSGAIQHIIVPDSLVGVGNGRMIGKQSLNDGTTMYSWQVKNTINNYCIVPCIGKYVHFSETYDGEKGKLDMDYWVLTSNLEKAKTQFKDAARMMKAFEYWFGPYPFYEDGYKLIETPYLGMETQSGIAYGNGYQNGYLGKDRSASGWGLKWDFIIVHESGHEWFANSITSSDVADMWIHEAFTSYSEVLFTDYYYGHQAGNEYVQGIRKNIENDIPSIGIYGVNKEGSSDMYWKGSNMIHIIRQVINNDEKFRDILKGLNKTFYHSVVNTKQVETYINKHAGFNFSKIFDQYLRTKNVPVLEYKISKNIVSYRWNNVVDGFNLPIKLSFEDQKAELILKPSSKWQTVTLQASYNKKTLPVNRNYYITTKLIED